MLCRVFRVKPMPVEWQAQLLCACFQQCRIGYHYPVVRLALLRQLHDQVGADAGGFPRRDGQLQWAQSLTST